MIRMIVSIRFQTYKYLLIFACFFLSVLSAKAGEGDEFFHISGGYLYNNTLNASIGYERELTYDNAIEIFGEAGDRWEKDPVCGKVCSKSFWKRYYWDGGLVYKKSMKQWLNSSLRIDVGPVFGAYRGKFFYGVEGSFEYNYVFRSGWKLVIKQKNNVSFRNGDSFRDGVTVGIKIPL